MDEFTFIILNGQCVSPQLADQATVDLPGTAFGSRRGGLAGRKAETLVERPGTADHGTRVIGSERFDLQHAGAVHEPSHRVGHQCTASALSPRRLRNHEPADVITRGLASEQQPAEQPAEQVRT